MATVLEGFGTSWAQVSASAEAQAFDNDLAWQVMFAYGGPAAAARMIRFAGMPDVDTHQIRQVLIDKQRHAEEAVPGGVRHGDLPADRCALCRLPFGIVYDDPTFGTIRIERNRRNRYYCNVCDAFIRICPGQATLELPVLAVDVKGSREIRARVGDLKTYSRLVAHFQRRIASVIQEYSGFVLNTIGDAVIGVWPSGFVPDDRRERLGWDPDRPARASARQAIAAAQAIGDASAVEFDGIDLPIRGGLDTTDMIIFSVASADAEAARWVGARPADKPEVGDPVIGADASDIGLGPAAVDVAGEAVETATDIANDENLPAGRLCVTERTDVVAGMPLEAPIYEAFGQGRIAARVL